MAESWKAMKIPKESVHARTICELRDVRGYSLYQSPTHRAVFDDASRVREQSEIMSETRPPEAGSSRPYLAVSAPAGPTRQHLFHLLFVGLLMVPSTASATLPCTVTFRLSDAVTIGALQWDTDYASAPGYFLGEGTKVQCSKLIQTWLSGFSDNDDEQTLDSGLISTVGFTGPRDITKCTFVASTLPALSDFVITVSEASGPDLNPILPQPDVVITSIDCGDPFVCGNGIKEIGEACDDGNTLNTDHCTGECRYADCGDGYVWAEGEQCDDGNTANTDSCLSDCTLAACGDGRVWSGVEECDQGDGNSDADANACRTDCTTHRCGDHVKDSDEQCDDGNEVNTDACLDTCKVATCGDGHARTGVEQCDDGDLTSGDGCDSNCKITACGNGIVTAGEACDDGNAANTDACLTLCEVAVCGDGYVRSGVEQCDDSDLVSGDGCDANCKVTACGNGIVTAGEECDDGNKSNSDACPATCRPAVCGDGFVRSGFEQCDDAGTGDGDGCSRVCQVQQLCGDATDDGNIFASDALRILQRGVGMDVECPTWICDSDAVDGVGASDALRILRRSVDLPTVLSCGDPTSIVVRITTSALLGSLQLDLGYQSVAGEIEGSGGSVDCEVLQTGAQSAFNDKPERVLSASFVSLSGIVGTGSLARCGFSPNGNVDPEDFTVTVVDAKDKNGNTVAKPGVKVVPY